MQKLIDTITALLALVGALYAIFSALSKVLPTGSRAQLLFARLAIAFAEMSVQAKRPDASPDTQKSVRTTLPPGPPLAMLCLWLVGCSGFAPGNTIASPARCAALDDRASMWGAIAAGAGLLGGGTGLSTIASDDKAVRVSLAVGSLVSGALAAGAAYAAHESSQGYVEENCAKVAEKASKKK